MYTTVYFEVSGICNAKCPYCVTGNKSVIDKFPGIEQRSNQFVTVENFRLAIDRLIELNLIGRDTIICLYNWGEPLLHPNLKDLLRILKTKNIHFRISTNASKVLKFERGLLTHLDHLTISMPGFSQESYDRIHGFNFNKILLNIDRLLSNFREAGFTRKASIAYHIYQFNLGEIVLARDFCFKRKMNFSPMIAYINDYNLAISFLNKTLEYNKLDEMARNLLLYYVDELINKSPMDYNCPQYDILTVDSACKVLTCCNVAPDHQDYSIGSLFQLSREDILTKKKQQNICKECIGSGLAYWVHNLAAPKIIHDLNNNRLKLFYIKLRNNAYFKYINILKGIRYNL